MKITAEKDEPEVEQDEAGQQYQGEEEEQKFKSREFETGVIGDTTTRIRFAMAGKDSSDSTPNTVHKSTSQKIKPPTDFPKTKPKMLKVTVIDIKSEVQSDF